MPEDLRDFARKVVALQQAKRNDIELEPGEGERSWYDKIITAPADYIYAHPELQMSPEAQKGFEAKYEAAKQSAMAKDAQAGKLMSMGVGGKTMTEKLQDALPDFLQRRLEFTDRQRPGPGPQPSTPPSSASEMLKREAAGLWDVVKGDKYLHVGQGNGYFAENPKVESEQDRKLREMDEQLKILQRAKELSGK